MLTLEEFIGMTGQEVGLTGWAAIGQDRIDQFADVTEDWQFIHIDPDAAARSPFGGTIAHGFLTLSMLSKFAYEALPSIQGSTMGVNYGFNRIRMLSPVPAGARIRARFRLAGAERKPPNRALFTYEVAVEIEGQDRPALIAEWLGMEQMSDGAGGPGAG